MGKYGDFGFWMDWWWYLCILGSTIWGFHIDFWLGTAIAIIYFLLIFMISHIKHLNGKYLQPKIKVPEYVMIDSTNVISDEYRYVGLTSKVKKYKVQNWAVKNGGRLVLGIRDDNNVLVWIEDIYLKKL